MRSTQRCKSRSLPAHNLRGTAEAQAEKRITRHHSSVVALALNAYGPTVGSHLAAFDGFPGVLRTSHYYGLEGPERRFRYAQSGRIAAAASEYLQIQLGDTVSDSVALCSSLKVMNSGSSGDQSWYSESTWNSWCSGPGRDACIPNSTYCWVSVSKENRPRSKMTRTAKTE